MNSTGPTSLVSRVEQQILSALGTHALPDAIAPSGVIVAAHPDDEVIGAAARLSRWSDSRVVHVTDGAPKDMRDARALGIGARGEYAALRRAERRHALELATVSQQRMQDIGIVDGEATYELVRLTTELYALFRAAAPEIVVTHPYEGGHPDHDATTFAVHAAVQLLAYDDAPAPVVVEMTSYHLGPNGISTGCFLPSRHSLVFHTPLDDATRSLKQRMLACHASQHAVLRYFRSDIEPIRIAPPYNFTMAPHPGLLFYEHMSWGITGAEWREHARVASRALGLRGRGEWLP